MYVSIDSLKEGMIVIEPIFVGNAALISAGKVLTTPLIDIIKKHRNHFDFDTLKISLHNLTEEQIMEIKNDVEWNHNNINTSIDPQIMDDIKNALRGTIQTTDDKTKDVERYAKIITNSLYWNKLKTDPDTNEKSWSSTLEFDLSEYGDSDLYGHLLRVAAFSTTLAAAYNKKMIASGKRSETISLEKITTAALLHDYGIRFQDPLAMQELQKHSLNEYLVRTYGLDKDLLSQPYNKKYSPIYSFVSLPLDNTTASIILCSQENDNKAGPLKTTKDSLNTTNNIKMAARIINLANLYDTVLGHAINNGLHGETMNLENVSTVMDYAAMNGMVDKELMDIFYENIPIYSNGTRVQLSDGRYARVINRTINKKLSSRPTVITTDMETIDLSAAPLNLTIKRIVTKDEKLSSLVNDIAHGQLNNTNIFYH